MYLHHPKIALKTKMSTAIIRPIKKSDNQEIAKVIREVLIEMGVPKVGTAYADAALDKIFETYDVPRAQYFVAELDGKLVGSAGIAQLQNYDGPVCELQKMYFLNIVRGKGLGAQMMKKCLDFARENDYSQVYIETMPNMESAQKLYVKTGFHYIDGPMGDTGHSSCPIHMLMDLKA
ncbi:MAG: GNAT family N-acetyltransferase [Leeuwenhoekiella sp.]